MSASVAPTLQPREGIRVGRLLPPLALGAAALVGGAAVAVLVAGGLWYVVPIGMLVVPAFVLLHRYPMAAIAVWLLVAPLVAETDSTSVRAVNWLIHRSLPLLTLAVIVVGSAVGIGNRRLARLGWPEVLMAGYVVATVLSILYSSPEGSATMILFYERVVMPMCLYLIVRLLRPNERDLRWLLPAVVVLLVTQAAFGVASWIAPGALPAAWSVPGGERTTGSLADPNTYGSTMLFCGVVVLSAGLAVQRRPVARMPWILLFVLALLMVFMTFGRANWVAGVLVVLGTMLVYRGTARWIVAITVPVVAVLLASGIFARQLEFAEQRLISPEAQEQATSRLPAVIAAVRLFETRPVAGWGYDSFEDVSRPFQRSFGSIIYAQKSRASHNLFLTLLAEQGIVGIALFLGPTIIWFRRSFPAARRMRPDGLTGRRFLWALWLVILGFLVVNNFAVMHSTVGLGLWWTSLGLIASLVDRHTPRPSVWDPRAVAGAASAEAGASSPEPR